MRELVAWKYYWKTLYHDVKGYVKGCDVCLAFKAMRYKPNSNFQLLPVLTHWWKDLSMDFVIKLSIFTNWESNSYDLILVIVDWLTKIVYYQLIKFTINTLGLAEVILDVVVHHYGLPNSIISDRGAVFTSNVWSSLCYFFGIKRKLSTAFHLQTNGQTKRQNNTMKAYLRAFVNYKQNDWVKLLPIAQFAYNNAKNVSTNHTPFELNYGYHPRVSYKKDFDFCSKSKAVDKLAGKLKNLMILCWKKLYYAQKVRKRAYNKDRKPKSYAPSYKFWLNNKYIKTNRNYKLKAKFFDLFEYYI